MSNTPSANVAPKLHPKQSSFDLTDSEKQMLKEFVCSALSAPNVNNLNERYFVQFALGVSLQAVYELRKFNKV